MIIIMKPWHETDQNSNKYWLCFQGPQMSYSPIQNQYKTISPTIINITVNLMKLKITKVAFLFLVLSLKTIKLYKPLYHWTQEGDGSRGNTEAQPARRWRAQRRSESNAAESEWGSREEAASWWWWGVGDWSSLPFYPVSLPPPEAYSSPSGVRACTDWAASPSSFRLQMALTLA